MILASFLDPNNNGFDIVDVGEIIGVCSAIVFSVYRTTNWLLESLREEIKDVVDEKLQHYTQPIQPGYRNGGESLADLAHTVKAMARHLGIDE